jgi:hypothetical protein
MGDEVGEALEVRVGERLVRNELPALTQVQQPAPSVRAADSPSHWPRESVGWRVRALTFSNRSAASTKAAICIALGLENRRVFRGKGRWFPKRRPYFRRATAGSILHAFETRPERGTRHSARDRRSANMPGA